MQARKLFVDVARSCCVLGCLAAVVLLSSGCRRRSSAPTGPGTNATTQGAGSYELFEKYRKCAEEGRPYPSLPGKGKKLGLAHFLATEPFCISLEEGIVKQAKLAGFAKDDMIIMDNKYNADLGRKNADIMLAKRPAAFIECQVEENVNRTIGRKFVAAGIPIVGVDVAVPGSPFVGVNNWNVAVMGGKEMARLIKKQWGGWDAVDMVVLLQMPYGGERTLQRSEGFAAALKEEFGDKVEKKIVRADGGPGQSEKAKVAMDNVLAAHPKAKKIAVTSVDEQTMAGVIASLQVAGRWNADDIIIITLGGDGLGQFQIRKGLSDAGIAFFPERYGRYIIPALCAMMQGQPVPPEIYVENEVLTRENIDKYYPKP